MESQRLRNLTERVLNEVALKHGFTNPRLDFSDATKKAENFIGKVYRFVLTDADSSSRRLDVIVKLPPADELFRKAVQVDAYFRVEAHMYGKVLPALADCYKKKNLIPEDAVFPSTARTYALFIEDEEKIIVMEDLKPKGFVMKDRIEGLDKNHCCLVLRSIARLHAASLALQKDNPQLHESLTESLRENLFHREKISDNFRTAGEMFRGYIDDRFPLGSPVRNKVESFLENYQSNMQKILRRNSTLCCVTHGDLWVNNMLFKYKEGSDIPHELVFVDFQMARMTSPVIDLAFVLTLGTSDETQHLYMDYVRYYHESLCSSLEELGHNPEKIVPWNLLQEEIRKYGCYGWAIAIVMWPLANLVEEDIEQLQKFKGHYAQTHHFVEKKNSARIKKRFVQILEQAEQLGILVGLCE